MEQQRTGMPMRIITPKARQEGVSTFSEAVIFDEISHKPNRNGLVIAHKKDSAQYLFDMTRFYLSNMPFKRRTDFSSRKEIIYAAPHYSAMRIESAENRDAGRSFTNHYVHCSEVAYWPDPARTMAGLLPTVPDIPDSLVILESTGKGLGDYFYDTYMKAKAGKNEWAAVFLAWFEDPRYALPPPEGLTWAKMDLEPEEVILRDAHKLSMGQLLWRRWKVRQMNHDMDRFRQEYPATDVECFLASGRPVFRNERVADAMTNALPIRMRARITWEGERPQLEPSQTGALKIWRPPQESCRYVVGVDTAQGFASSDWSVACVLDGDTGEQVAELAGRWDVANFAHLVVGLGTIYNRAFVAIEINNHGLSVLGYVREEGYWNLLNRRTYDQAQRKWMNKQGWQTSVKTKPIMVDHAVQMFHHDEGAIVHSQEVLDQMTRFNFNEDGEPETPKGKNDDHLFAWMIALQAFKWQGQQAAPAQEVRTKYSGQDAWAWRSMDRHIQEADRQKRARAAAWGDHVRDLIG